MTPEEVNNAIEAEWRRRQASERAWLEAEVTRLRDGIEDLRERIIQGANELDRMARELEHTTDNVRPHVRLLAKAEGMRVVLDYLRLLDPEVTP